jgi:hypothetical protein
LGPGAQRGAIREDEKMICNFKALGLALVAVFAMSAIAASAALAQQGFATSTGPFTISVTETGAKGSGSNALTAFGTKIECFGTTYVGHKVLTVKETEEGKEHGLIPNGSKEVTITPNYNEKECRAFVPEELDATVEPNGCDFLLHIGETTEKFGTYGVSADVVCFVGKMIHIGVWPLGTKEHLSANRLCTYIIPAQNGLKGAHLTNTGASPDDVDLTGTFTNILVKREGICTLDGKGKETKEGKFDVDITAKGTTAVGANTGLTISD